MASNVSQSYPYNQTVFRGDENELCQLSAAVRASSILVNHHIQYAGGVFDAVGGTFPSSITSSMVFDNTGVTSADQQHSGFPHPLIEHSHHKLMQLDKYDSSVTAPPSTTYPERLGLSDLVVPDLYSTSTHGFNCENQLGHHDSCSYRNDSCDLGMAFIMDYCQTCADIDHLKPIHYELGDMNWGIRANQARIIDDESSTKVSRYTSEERKERILRYINKRNQRNFNKTIKYACRKTLADRRVRVRGRFAKNNDSRDNEETSASMDKAENPKHKETESLFFGDDIDVLIKQDDDDDRWLQEAMASLIYPSNCTDGCSIGI